ncbi:MAG: 3,4-dihydroxy-2-butanone-4-phosphate synthase, partial [Candidatus Gracilibacteria bacterium]
MGKNKVGKKLPTLNSIEEALREIKKGNPVIVVDDEDRENEGDLIMAADKVTPEKVNFYAKEGRGLICMPIEKTIADRLDLPSMTLNNTESTRCNFTISVDAKKDVSTGTSAKD